MNPKADVLIVTVTPIESRSVIKAFKEATGNAPKMEHIKDRTYHNLGSINGASIYMAISQMGAGGVGGSQETVRKGIEALNPAAVIMVGIAFGVNPTKQRIGDILVSHQLRPYELQRYGKDEIILRGDKPPASAWLYNLLQSIALYWDESNGRVKPGVILTGEKLVDNVDYRDQLVSLEKEAIGGEMEGAGLYVACHDYKKDWILVKAICDWADGEKDNPHKDEHQEIAAHNAASFVVFALQQVQITQNAPQPEADKPKETPLTKPEEKPSFHTLLAQGRTGQVIEQLLALTALDKYLNNEVILLSSRYAAYQRKLNNGTVSSSSLSIDLNRINQALIAIIDKLPPNLAAAANKVYNINHIDNANFS
ncbi:MAG: hypothetical protein GC192_17860 [Bacteroidetes bacterium]|nr:hypothetical protein [Bacteroidota bacterium]